MPTWLARRMSALVPRCSGHALSLLISTVASARPSGVSDSFVILPMGRVAIVTRSPVTSWPASVNWMCRTWGCRAAREQHDEGRRREEQAGERDDPARPHPPTGDRGLLPQNNCVPTIPMAWMPMMFTAIERALALPTPIGPPLAV